MVAKADAKPAGDFSIITRDDGVKQWAYKGHPLYLWVNDLKPGDKTGDGFRHGLWHLAKVEWRSTSTSSIAARDQLDGVENRLSEVGLFPKLIW